jgi:hypothetical protein
MIAKRVPIQQLHKSHFGNLVEYLVSEKNAYRVGGVRITNCQSETVEWTIQEILATQARNTRAQSDKTYHLIVSFPEGEEPPESTLHAIEDRICEGLGFARHQRLSVIHRDTDNLHFHLAINKIHPERLTIYEPYYDHKKLGELCAALELHYGLIQDNHQARKTGQRAEDMERFTGIESLTGYLRRECLERLQAVSSWAEVHTLLAEQGIGLKLRGNGLVFTEGADRFVKASAVDRLLSKGQLEARLGPFQAAETLRAEPGRDRTKVPRPRRPERPVPLRVETGALWEAYQQEREGRKRARQTGRMAARDRLGEKIEAAKRAWSLKRKAIQLLGGKAERRLSYALARRQFEAALQDARAEFHRALRENQERHAHRNWVDWLQVQAKAGHPEALAALRARRARTEAGDRIQGQAALHEPPGEAHLTRGGSAVFTLAGTTLRDDGERLRIAQHQRTDEGLVQALKLAVERYGETLSIQGSAEFREQIARAAVAGRVRVKFDDPALDARRRALQEAERGAAASEQTHPRGRSR